MAKHREKHPILRAAHQLPQLGGLALGHLLSPMTGKLHGDGTHPQHPIVMVPFMVNIWKNYGYYMVNDG